MSSFVKEALAKIDAIISDLEDVCEYRDENILMQRLMDARASFLEVCYDKEV